MGTKISNKKKTQKRIWMSVPAKDYYEILGVNCKASYAMNLYLIL